MTDWDTLVTDAATIRDKLSEELRAIYVYNDPNLSSEGRAIAREKERVNVANIATAAMDRLNIQVNNLEQNATTAVRKYLEADRPTRDEWDRVQMLLESGRTLQDLIASADADRLRAIAEWGPTYVESQVSPRLDRNTDPSVYKDAVRNDVLKRWAELTTDPAPLNAMKAGPAKDAIRAIEENLRLLIAGRVPSASDTLRFAYGPTSPISLQDLYRAISRS